MSTLIPATVDDLAFTEQLEPIACKIELLETAATTAILQIAREAAKIHGIFRYRRNEGGYTGYMKKRLGYSSSSAYRLLDVHARFSENVSQAWERLPLSAIYLLAAPSTPKEALNEIAERIGAGNKPTVTEVQNVIKRTKGVAVESPEKPENEAGKTPKDEAKDEAGRPPAVNGRSTGNDGNNDEQADNMKQKLAALAGNDPGAPPLVVAGDEQPMPDDVNAGELQPVPVVAGAADPEEEAPDDSADEQPTEPADWWRDRYRGPDGQIDHKLEQFEKAINTFCAGECLSDTFSVPPNLPQDMVAKAVGNIDGTFAALAALKAKIVAGDATASSIKTDADRVDEYVAAIAHAHDLGKREGLWASFNVTRRGKARKQQTALRDVLVGVREIAEFKTGAAAKAHRELAERMAGTPAGAPA